MSKSSAGARVILPTKSILPPPPPQSNSLHRPVLVKIPAQLCYILQLYVYHLPVAGDGASIAGKGFMPSVVEENPNRGPAMGEKSISIDVVLKLQS